MLARRMAMTIKNYNNNDSNNNNNKSLKLIDSIFPWQNMNEDGGRRGADEPNNIFILINLIRF